MPFANVCCQCRIASDDFNRADADSLGANWTEESGDADISSNELLWASTGIATHATTHPGGASAPARVKVKFKRSATTEHARVILGWTDASNYLYASVETVSGCDVLRLFQVVGGSATEVQDAQMIGDGAPVDVWHTLEACLEPDNYPASGDIFRAKVTLDSGKVYGSQAESGDYAGGTKSGIAGSTNVRMEDFYFGWMKDEDTACKQQCPECKTPCLIDSDSFPGGTETTCKWDSGKFRVFHPEAGTKHYATATFDLQDGENAEVRVNMKADGSEYHWATLALSGTTLTLTVGKTGSTLDTVTGTGAAGEHSLTACFDGAMITGSSGSLDSAFFASTTIEDGIYAGRSGTADFTDFEFQKHFSADDPACPNCEEPPHPCDPCETGEGPQAYAITISGVTGADGVLMNGTWIVFASELGCTDPHDFTAQCTGNPCCRWVGTFPGDLGTTYVSVVQIFVCGTTLYVSVKYQCSLASGCCITGECKVRFSKNFSPDAVPCTELLNELIPLMSNGAAPTLDVDTTNAVCEATAL